MSTLVISRWWTGGENASATCLEADTCDFETGYSSLSDITRRAKSHVFETGHAVEIESSRFRVVRFSKMPETGGTTGEAHAPALGRDVDAV